MNFIIKFAIAPNDLPEGCFGSHGSKRTLHLRYVTNYAMAPLEKLPLEILQNILLQLIATAGISSLAPCLLCCKTWHKAVLPLLYDHIVLRNSNLPSFWKSFNSTSEALVRSLTMTIDYMPTVERSSPPPTVDPVFDAYVIDERNRSVEAQPLWFHVRQTCGSLARMRNLTTFSFTVLSGDLYNSWIPCSILGMLVQALPESCVNLEIDTQGEDLSTRSYHICDKLRNVLPRLRHFRLRLKNMCPALLGGGFDPTGSENYFTTFKPATAPFLKTLAINCNPRTPGNRRVPFCTSDASFGLRQYFPHNTHDIVVQALEIAKDSGCFPVAERIHVLQVLLNSYPLSIYYRRCTDATFSRSQVLDNIALAIPFHKIVRKGQDYLLIRTQEEQDLIGNIGAVEAFAEGGMWSQSRDGVRGPTCLLMKRGALFLGRESQVQNAKEWTSSNLSTRCMLWFNEKILGRRWMDFETE